MIRPWERSRTRLGMDLGVHAGNGAYLGWAVIEHAPIAKARGWQGEVHGDPRAAALVEARAAIADGAQGVDLYAYADDAAFAQSQAALDGMTRDAHCLAIQQTAADLREERIDVVIHWLRGKGVPSAPRSKAA